MLVDSGFGGLPLVWFCRFLALRRRFLIAPFGLLVLACASFYGVARFGFACALCVSGAPFRHKSALYPRFAKNALSQAVKMEKLRYMRVRGNDGTLLAAGFVFGILCVWSAYALDSGLSCLW